jgi:arginine/lysine/ornithine decarboxylase
MEQQNTPLYNQLLKHIQNNPISFHVPGHKYGTIRNERDTFYFERLLSLDVTELSDLDDLHSPEGVILEAEELLSDLYKVQKSYFLVNGSTVGNLAMLLATLEENDIVLVQRNCHKSILNGIELACAKPVFLDPVVHNEWGIAGGISIDIVRQALDQYKNIKAIVLTYPNYYGIVNELGKIIQMAHSKTIPVLVDEAHGTHFISGGSFPKSAVELGADIVIQSAHKTLPAMTMGSFLHFNSKLLSLHAVERYLRILQSSSPSYPIMASLDLARSYIGTYRDEDHIYLREEIDRFKFELKQLDSIKVLDYDDEGDLLKITIQSATVLSGFQMQTLFEKHGIYTELADPLNVLLVLPLLKKGRSYPFQTAAAKMKVALQDKKKQKRSIPVELYKPKISTLAMGINEFKLYRKRKVSLSEAVGMIAADKIIPYPPGIPLLYPGEIVTQKVVDQIDHLVSIGAKFQGSKDIYQRQLFIFEK